MHLLLFAILPALATPEAPWAAEAFPLPVVWATWPASLTAEEADAAVEHAVAAWNGASGCGPVTLVAAHGDAPDDGSPVIVIEFDDPEDRLADGVLQSLSVTTQPDPLTGAPVAQSAKLVYSEAFPWSTMARVEGGTCERSWVLEAVLAHDLGDALGVPHSCEQGEACSDEERAATMYWNLAVCDTSAATLEAYDAELLQGTYVGGVHPVCVLDDATRSATCAVSGGPDEPPTTVRWTFGDGDTSEALEATHTWSGAGPWTVEACATWTSCAAPACGTTEVSFVEPDPPSEEDPGDEAETGDTCGCVTLAGGPPALLVALLPALLLRRRRPA